MREKSKKWCVVGCVCECVDGNNNCNDKISEKEPCLKRFSFSSSTIHIDISRASGVHAGTPMAYTASTLGTYSRGSKDGHSCLSTQEESHSPASPPLSLSFHYSFFSCVFGYTKNE
eukprot:m.15491 g.15491  ORF g.15491 m.15491 type:complete len:116 (+) comp7860_c0_seq1:306-653(+)